MFQAAQDAAQFHLHLLHLGVIDIVLLIHG